MVLLMATGHISIRHPNDPSIYIMSGYMAPAIVVSTSEGLIRYRVWTSEAIEPRAQKGYSESFIHGGIYKCFRGVNCVIHSHAEEVLP